MVAEKTYSGSDSSSAKGVYEMFSVTNFSQVNKL